jgi:hypothetical protein
LGISGRSGTLIAASAAQRGLRRSNCLLPSETDSFCAQ